MCVSIHLCICQSIYTYTRIHTYKYIMRLMTEMLVSFISLDHSVVVAATNRIQNINAALLRRFERNSLSRSFYSTYQRWLKCAFCCTISACSTKSISGLPSTLTSPSSFSVCLIFCLSLACLILVFEAAFWRVIKMIWKRTHRAASIPRPAATAGAPFRNNTVNFMPCERNAQTGSRAAAMTRTPVLAEVTHITKVPVRNLGTSSSDIIWGKAAITIAIIFEKVEIACEKLTVLSRKGRFRTKSKKSMEYIRMLTMALYFPVSKRLLKTVHSVLAKTHPISVVCVKEKKSKKNPKKIQKKSVLTLADCKWRAASGGVLVTHR